MPISRIPDAKPSPWHLGGLTPSRLIRNVIEEINHDDLLGAASNLAFNWLLALFPMLVFLLAIFGIFASHFSQLEDSLLSFSAGLLPYDAHRLVRRVAGELIAGKNGVKAIFGAAAALFFASGGLSALISTMNIAYRLRETRPWLKIRAIALLLTFLLALLLLPALFMVIVGDRLVSWAHVRFGWSAMPVLWKALQWPAAALFVTVSFSLIDYFGLNRQQHRWNWLNPGSVFGVLVWLAASLGLRVYLHFFNSYTGTYGSLGAVIILLLWLYVTGFAFLIGGAINAEIERASSHGSREG